MSQQTITADTAAEAYLTILAARGVDYLFGNAGTDFASIIEALSKAQLGEAKAPMPVTVPHENVAVAMAHGYYLMTDRPQAVMLHVSVGTANGICGVLNASRDRVPLLFSAGRTPINEDGPLGSRSIYIHWAQEMFDQAGMVREAVKWDYELRNTQQIETIVDRALTLAMTEPRGPVYLTLPREPLAETFDQYSYQSPSRRATPTQAWPSPDAIEQIADILAKAESPLIITQDSGTDQNSVAPLAALAERFAIPVVQRKPRYMCLPTDHPLHLGYDPDPFLDEADVIIVADCDVPWIPSVKAPKADCTVIHMGTDPIYASYPIRGYEADLAVTGALAPAFRLLDDALSTRENGAASRIDSRRKKMADLRETLHARWQGTFQENRTSAPMHPSWVSHCVDQIKGDDSIVMTESSFSMAQMNFRKPGTFFSGGAGGGLGYGLGMSLGAKLAARDRLVICTQGDGAYMYGNPISAHYVSRAEKLPTLTLIMNNEQWGAVKRNTRAMYPDGFAAKSNREPLTFFEGDMAFEKAVEIAGGYGERVVDPEELPKALDRAVDMVQGQGRAAVLNISTA